MLNSPFDQILIILYFLIILGFGFYKKSKQDEISFLFAGRKLTIIALVATLVSTWYGGILEIGRFTYENGIVTWVIFGLCYYIAAFLFAIFIAPQILKSNFSTIPELFHHNFGKQAKLIAIFCIFIISTPAPYIKILSDLINHVFGVPKVTALIIGIIISIAYTFTGGFSAVIRTDKFQFIIMFSGFAILLLTCYNKFGGISFLINNTPQYAFSIPGNLNWSYIATWSFIALITFIDPSFYQRSYSTSSIKTIRTGIFISIVFWMIFDFMTIFTSLYALAIIPTIKLNPFYDLAQLVLNPITHALFIVSLFAIVMSTIDSFSFISAYTIGKDLTSWINIKQNNQRIIQFTQIGLIATGLISIILAIYFDHAIDIWYTTGSLVVPVLLIPLIASLYKITIKKPILVLTMPGIISLLWHLYGIFNQSNIGHAQFLLGLDPMIPGLISSCILFLILKE